MNSQIYEEASDWIVRHRNGGLDAADRPAFDAWLRESPQHVQAYLEMSSVWENLPALDRVSNPGAEELIARAREDGNVVALAPPAKPPSAPVTTSARAPVRRHRKVALLSALAASVLIACGAIGWLHLQRGTYATDVGEQRSMTLTDGSTVELNARSRIRVRYAEAERLIDLLEGQALFHVARDKVRPFIVRTGETRVQAIGTAFDVYRTPSGAIVTVLEGSVAVHTPKRAGIPIAAGEQLVVTPVAVEPPRRANIAAATAWTRRSLVFESSPLTVVAEEFNRYNDRPLVVQDPQLADFHVSGVFSSAEPTLLLQFLRMQPELLVEETRAGIYVRKK